MTTKALRTMLIVAAAFWLAGCQSWQTPKTPAQPAAPAQFNAADYKDIPADSGRVYWIDSDASDVRLYVWRGGPLARKGHNHVMVVKNIDGAVFLPADMLKSKMRMDLVFPVDGIEVDPPALRKEIGGSFDTKISPKGVKGTRRHMLGKEVLDAARYPTVGLKAAGVYGELPKLVLEMAVTLHGAERRLLVPATVKADETRLTAKGAFAIRQTDFNIEPFSALGGSLYILDPIMVEFRIVAKTR